MQDDNVVSNEIQPHHDELRTENRPTEGEIPSSWVYWSAGIGLALALLIILVADVIPLPRHVHHLDIADAFNIAWKVALLPPGVVTARIAIDRINLSKREHHHAVQVARNSEFDATQRRITELSAKASDQLGSDKATVRIGGLTDLERLGQNNPDLRQTVIDRICAYLQMAYVMPTREHEDDQPKANLASQAVVTQDGGHEARQEMKVRLTAQRILIRHTKWPQSDTQPPDIFWPGVALDLSDATLIDLDMSYCRIAAADFAGTRFLGNSAFDRMMINRYTNFGDARFEDNTSFRGVTFSGGVSFRATSFGGGASFNGTSFSGDAAFIGAAFSGRRGASFRSVTFGAAAAFISATFIGGVSFRGARFNGGASFRGATFSGGVSFDGARFGGNATFANTRISRISIGDGVQVSSDDLNLLRVDPESGHLTMHKPVGPS